MNIISLIREILKSRNIIWDLAKADFRKRFVGSYFGVAWMFVQPVVTVLIYFLIFQSFFEFYIKVNHKGTFIKHIIL